VTLGFLIGAGGNVTAGGFFIAERFSFFPLYTAILISRSNGTFVDSSHQLAKVTYNFPEL
jgi:hypothetical protein